MPKVTLNLTEQEAKLLLQILEIECDWSNAHHKVYTTEDAPLTYALFSSHTFVY